MYLRLYPKQLTKLAIIKSFAILTSCCRLGENLKRLNTAGLALAKIKLEQGEITKMEFMGTVKRAAANIQMAKKCFEDTQLVDK